MASCGSIHPHLTSLTNSHFSAVLERRLGRGPWGFDRSTRFISGMNFWTIPHTEHVGRESVAHPAEVSLYLWRFPALP
ncbi:hypothetical protein IB75_03775 [Nitrosococcus oceani C-27]|uniref:Uncharacterized protein n=1 Tax=Nitrosococcus oceani C-27 TaxID=314279 RepID=A0A0E2Z3L0_9GAMM|nr:hypothetical protein IB75_03775 [Nitrosococcus oceani C-27]KFI23340.1 hypothetical protein HW44_03665 [Nitrosococcus oceani]GEM20136.1 hypothetical protein NONS58_15430 [Nitrosococcus oceani]